MMLYAIEVFCMLLLAKHLQCTRSEKLHRSCEPHSHGGWVPSAELGADPGWGAPKMGQGVQAPRGRTPQQCEPCL